MFNPLPLIALFLQKHSPNQWEDLQNYKRTYLIDWINNQKVFEVKNVNLAADCLIAAGIGREWEQDGTVHGGYTYG